MDSAKSRYHIIKFTSGLPHPACCGYECIPNTWVTFHDLDKGAAVIKYPGRPVTVADIRNSRISDPGWSKFVVQVIFSTENYEEASTSLKLFQSDTSNVTPEETNHALPPRRTPRPSRADDQPPSAAKPKRTPPKEIKTVIKQIKKKKVVRRTNKKIIKKIVKNRINQQTTNIEPLYDQPISADPEVLKKLDEIESVFNAAQEILNKLHEDDNQSELLTKIMNIFNLNNHNEDFNENTDKYKRIDDEKVLLTPYVSVNRLDYAATKRKLENSSTWTLRYPVPGPGLVELLPNSKVYVKKVNLKAFQSLGNGRRLATSLLSEIFSDEALSKCSVAGGKTQFRRTGVVYPPLDKHARNVLFKYVIRRSKQRNWPPITQLDIAKLLGAKLCTLRK